MISAGAENNAQSLILKFKKENEFVDYLKFENINFRNISKQKAMFPIGGITCITGVSGSGKSTLVTALAESLDKNTARKYGEIYDGESIKRIIKVNQSPIGKTPRSTVVSYLGIFDEIRMLFSKTSMAKELNYHLLCLV